MEDSGMPINERSQEAEAFLEALDRTAPDVGQHMRGLDHARSNRTHGR